MAMPAGGSGITYLHGQRPRYAVRLAGLECQQEMAYLKLHTADGIHITKAYGNGPTRVDPADFVGGDLSLVALAKVESAQPELRAPDQEQQNRAAGRLWQLQPHHLQYRVENLQPVVEVAADQELLPSSPPEFERLSGLHPFRRSKISLRRLK